MAKTKRKRAKKKTVAKRKPVKRKVRRRRTVAKKRPVKRRRPSKKVIKQVERKSVERVIAGKKRRRRRSAKRRVAAVSGPRRRSVGKSGSGKMLMGLAIGAAAIYLLTRKSTTTTYPNTNYQLPALTQTNNYTRNTQSQDIVNYAIAAGLAVDAITKLIERLNSSSDQEVQNTYDVINTTGAQGLSYYV